MSLDGVGGALEQEGALFLVLAAAFAFSGSCSPPAGVSPGVALSQLCTLVGSPLASWQPGPSDRLALALLTQTLHASAFAPVASDSFGAPSHQPGLPCAQGLCTCVDTVLCRHCTTHGARLLHFCSPSTTRLCPGGLQLLA